MRAGNTPRRIDHMCAPSSRYYLHRRHSNRTSNTGKSLCNGIYLCSIPSYFSEPTSIRLLPFQALPNPAMKAYFSMAHREHASSGRIPIMSSYVAYPNALYAVLSEVLSVSKSVVRKSFNVSLFSGVLADASATGTKHKFTRCVFFVSVDPLLTSPQIWNWHLYNRMLI